MRVLRRTLPVLLAALLLGGCFTIQILPLTTEMEDIHDTYRREFSARHLPPGPGAAGGATQTIGQASQEGFTHTIEKIRAFQLRHPDRTTENAHLTVLEGMIYLQLGKLASATLMQDDVEKSGKALGVSADYAPRDRLFAQHFGTMIELAGLKAEYDEYAKGIDVTKFRPFEEKAKKIGTGICASLTRAPDEQKSAAICGAKQPMASEMAAAAGASGDGGPLYLAANAAIAYAWAYKGAEGICNANPDPGNEAQHQSCLNDARATYFSAASNLVRLFLTEAEGKFADAADTIIVTPDSGRTRYIRLLQELEACKKGEGCNLSN